jgi:hypothetical protein
MLTAKHTILTIKHMSIKTYTIAEIRTMVGQVIPAIQVAISKDWKSKQIAGPRGPFNVQNGEFSDSTGSIKFKLIGREPMTYNIGEVIWVKSNFGKNGLSGALVKKEEYTNKAGQFVSDVVLEVTKSAIIFKDGQESNGNGPRNDQIPVVNTNTAEPVKKDEVTKLKEALNGRVSPQQLNERLDKQLELYNYCYNRTFHMLNKDGKTATPEQVYNVANTMFRNLLEKMNIDQIDLNQIQPEEYAWQ